METTKERIETMRSVIRLGGIINRYQELSIEMSITDDSVRIVNNIIASKNISEDTILSLFNIFSKLEEVINKLEGK